MVFTTLLFSGVGSDIANAQSIYVDPDKDDDRPPLTFYNIPREKKIIVPKQDDETTRRRSPFFNTQPTPPRSSQGYVPQKYRSSTEFEKAFYANCTKQDSPYFTENGKHQFCACAADRINAAVPASKRTLITERSDAGQALRNQVAIDVYAPCMHHPVKDMLFQNCVQNDDVERSSRNASGLCDCISESMADFVASRAPAVMRTEIAKNPNVRNPLGAFLASDSYQDRSRQVLLACIQESTF